MQHHVHEVVHTLREKPVHVRENIALGVASGITFLVALFWFVANASSGTFALNTTYPDNAPTMNETVATGKNGISQLIGAAGAALGASSSPASITIVDTQVHSTLDTSQPDPSATVIHF